MSARTALNVAAPGILTNDTGGGGSLFSVLGSAPAHGTLSLTNNGGFRYTPTTGFVGIDSFTYRATDNSTTSGVSTVTITVNNSPVAVNDSYAVQWNSTFSINSPGILANDTGGSGPLTAILATGPIHGVLSLTNNGGFSYTPSNNFLGVDSFTYRATDGSITSGVATPLLRYRDGVGSHHRAYPQVCVPPRREQHKRLRGS